MSVTAPAWPSVDPYLLKEVVPLALMTQSSIKERNPETQMFNLNHSLIHRQRLTGLGNY